MAVDEVDAMGTNRVDSRQLSDRASVLTIEDMGLDLNLEQTKK